MFIPVLLHIISFLHPANKDLVHKTDPCEEAKAVISAATMLAKDSVFQLALINIKNGFLADRNEHCISFGKDALGNMISSAMSVGGTNSGTVPGISNAFADLHSHPNNLPPDAGDFYGLIRIHKNNPDYKTRFVVTVSGMQYALLVTNITDAISFIGKNPPQPPAYADGPPGFPVAITDEARELKYKFNCTDEVVLAFILEKYNTGVSLLKRQNDGSFSKLVAKSVKTDKGMVYSIKSCL